MFTGIVAEVGTVASVAEGRLVVGASSLLRRLEIGGSIAVNGVCLTVIGFSAATFSVDIMPETIKRTNLRLLSVGDKVNLELPLTLESQLGGHLVQGHIDAAGKVTSVTWDGMAMLMSFEVPLTVMRYIVDKGFIAVDGVSLTVVKKDAGSFWVSIVEYSRQHTTLGNRQVGDLVNLEVDIMAKYAEQFSQPQATSVTTEFLHEHGFL